jgi:hypothetical protein
VSDEPYPPLEPQPGTPVREQSPPWPLIIGVAFLALLAVAIGLILLSGGGEDPGAVGSPSASASASPSASASASASASPSTAASSAPSASPDAAFAPDDLAATAADSIALRAEPGLDGELIGRLPAGAVVFIVDGPESADGLPWYQVSGMGVPYGSGCVTPEPGGVLTCPTFFGWLAGAADDGTPYLQAADSPECPEPTHTVVSLSQIQTTLRLVCFDAEDMTFVAWWPELPEDAGLGGACAASETDVAWLVCQNINYDVLGASPDEPVGRFPISIDPDSGVTMPERDQWVEVTGHFDDVAAQDCGQASDAMEMDAGELVFNCRLQFVPTAVVVSAGP